MRAAPRRCRFAFQKCRRSVAAAIFDDDDLDLVAAKPPPAFESEAENRFVVERRHHDGQMRLGLACGVRSRDSAHRGRLAYAWRLRAKGVCTPPGSTRAVLKVPSRSARSARAASVPFGGSSGAPAEIAISSKASRASAARSDAAEKWLTCTRLSARVARYPARTRA